MAAYAWLPDRIFYLPLAIGQPLMSSHIGAKDLPVLEEEDTVRLKRFRLGQKTWHRGTVVSRRDERSYKVNTYTGTCRPKRVHLRKCNDPLIIQTPGATRLVSTRTKRAPKPQVMSRPVRNLSSPAKCEYVNKSVNRNQLVTQNQQSICQVMNSWRNDCKWCWELLAWQLP